MEYGHIQNHNLFTRYLFDEDILILSQYELAKQMSLHSQESCEMILSQSNPAERLRTECYPLLEALTDIVSCNLQNCSPLDLQRRTDIYQIEEALEKLAPFLPIELVKKCVALLALDLRA